MAKTLKQSAANRALFLGYILKNEHGFEVKLLKGRQVMTNPKRKRAYGFDYPTWAIVGRIPWYRRLENYIHLMGE